MYNKRGRDFFHAEMTPVVQMCLASNSQRNATEWFSDTPQNRCTARESNPGRKNGNLA